MKQAGFQAEIRSPGTDEIEIRGESPRQMVARLALEKAEAVAATILVESASGETVIIAADTTVVAPGGKAVLGKPKDEREAAKMLRKLSGQTHTVLTGYCILKLAKTGAAKRRVKVVSTRVKMRPLDASAIRRYIATGEPMDKAGAYGAQSIGMGLIETISGSYTNVVGLPIAQLMKDLGREFGVTPT